MFESKLIKNNNVTNKTFDYALGGCTLKFTLRIDIKKELKDYAEMLKVALKEVTEELQK